MKFTETAGDRHKQLVARLSIAVDNRNKLTPNYFWDRAVTFSSVEGRGEMLREPSSIGDRFVALDGEFSELTAGLVSKEVMQTHLEKLLSGAEAPHDPKRVQNPTRLVAAYEWRVGESENVKRNFVLASEGGKYLFWARKDCALDRDPFLRFGRMK